jgi:hypothetical protein
LLNKFQDWRYEKTYINRNLFNYLFLSLKLHSQQWLPFNSGLIGPEINCITSANDKIYAGTRQKGIFSSGINIADWKAINNKLDSNYIKYHTGIQSITISNNNIFAGTIKGLVKSTNEGTNWNLIRDGYMDSILTELSAIISIGDKIIYGTNGAVFLSTNNGVNWKLAESGYLFSMCSSLAYNGNLYFQGTNRGGFGRLLSSSDGGNKWDSLYEFDSGITSLAVKDSIIIVGTSYKGLYLSNDEGKSWSIINTGISKFGVTSIVITSNYIFACIDGIVYMTEKKSDFVWEPFFDGLSDAKVSCLSLNGNTLFAGTYGEGVFKLDLTTLDVENSIINEKIKLHPNPVRDILNIDLSLNYQDFANIKIYDELGNIIFVKDYFNNNKIQIDTRDLLSGIYYLQIISSRNTNTKKILVIH